MTVQSSQSSHAERARCENGGDGTAQRLAQSMGWFSLALGVAQVTAPRALVRLVGVDDEVGSRTVMRGVGARELVSAAGILHRSHSVGWTWGRVAGDVVDLSLLDVARTAHGHDDDRRRRIVAATVAAVGITLLDLVTVVRLIRTAGSVPGGRPRRATTSTTIRRSPQDLYRYWHDFENLPSFMYHLESVQVADGRSHWTARAPMGRTVEWDAEVTEDRPGELIGWRALRGSDVDNSGSVRFTPAPGGRGTEVTVEVEYAPPAGSVGVAVARLLGEEPGQQISDDLRRFKQLMETGEVVRSEGSPTGTGVRHQVGQRPARPLR